MDPLLPCADCAMIQLASRAKTQMFLSSSYETGHKSFLPSSLDNIKRDPNGVIVHLPRFSLTSLAMP